MGKYCNIPEDGIYQGVYPIKIFNLALQFWKGGIDVETAKDVHPVKDVWADFIGFTTQTQFLMNSIVNMIYTVFHFKNKICKRISIL